MYMATFPHAFSRPFTMELGLCNRMAYLIIRTHFTFHWKKRQMAKHRTENIWYCLVDRKHHTSNIYAIISHLSIHIVSL